MKSIHTIIKKHFPSITGSKLVKVGNVWNVYADAGDSKPTLSLSKPHLSNTEDIEEQIISSAALKLRHCWNMGYKEKVIIDKYPELSELNISEMFKLIQDIKG